MLERCRYVNHKGEVIQFGEPPYFLNQNNLRDYILTFDTNARGRITRYKRELQEKVLPIFILNGDNATNVRDRLFDVVEKDIAANEKGKIYIGDYYLKGVVFASEKKNYLNPKFMSLELKFITEDSLWCKDIKFSFVHGASGGVSGDGLKYPYRYPYKYGPGKGAKIINVESVLASEFELIIYGPIVDPSIKIGKNTYSIFTTAYPNEYILAKSESKSIFRYKVNGQKENEFENKASGIFFNEIPSGENVVQANCTFDLLVHMKRGEPVWNS